MTLALCLALAACSEDTPPPAPPPPPTGLTEPAQDWPTHGGQPGSSQYSSLEQINLETVADLDVAWTYHAGEISDGSEGTDATSYQVTPIYTNGMLYLCTPYNTIVALDPDTGAEVWRHDPHKPKTGTMYGAHVCRGVSYWQAEDAAERERPCGKRIFETMSNATLLAVDADTGATCTEFGTNGRVDLTEYDYHGTGLLASTSPPAIYRDAVIVGGTLRDNREQNAKDGIVRAFNARTGAEIWHWNPIPPHLSDATGAANVWSIMSVDTERGWVFLPTGSPSHDVFGANRTDPVPNGNAVVVLDALTGEKIWSRQLVHHDLWDYDLPAAPTLIDVIHNGRSVPAVMQPTKMGFVFLLDRETGTPLFDVEERAVAPSDIPGEQASPTQPFPVLPAPVATQSMSAEDAWGVAIFDRMSCRNRLAALRNDGMYTPPSIGGSILQPSFLGGTNWGGIAYDPASGIAVVNASNLVSSITLVPREQYDPAVHAGKWTQVMDMEGSPYVLLREPLMSAFGAPCNPPPWGTLTALDMTSGATLWQIPFGRVKLGGLIRTPAAWGAPNTGGPIVTAGGLVFIGASLDGRLRGYNLYTGEEVWSHTLPAPATATPMTFSHGPSGTQYLVIAAGGHTGFDTPQSDSIVAFKLKSDR